MVNFPMHTIHKQIQKYVLKCHDYYKISVMVIACAEVLCFYFSHQMTKIILEKYLHFPENVLRMIGDYKICK
mgnify:CR=1 FL=1